MAEASSNSTAAKASLGRWLASMSGNLAALAVVGVASAAGLSAIYASAEADSGLEPTPPLPVAAERLEVVDFYETHDVYVGRVEPARETALGFRRGGELVEVLADEGDDVETGQPVARLDVESLIAQQEQLAADILRLEADLALAKRTRERQDKLSGGGYASEQRADEARTRQTTVEAQIVGTKAQLRSVNIDIDKSTIHAPFSGVVAERLVDPGTVVAAGQAVVQVLETAQPQARIGVPAEAAAKLTIGESYRISVRGEEYLARLTTVRPDVDPISLTMPALFELQFGDKAPQQVNTTGSPARPVIAPFGAVARLALPHRVEARGAWVPLTALQEDAKGLWRILILKSSGDGVTVVAGESVEVIHTAGDRAFVRGAFGDDDRYIAHGVNRVAVGDEVAPDPKG